MESRAGDVYLGQIGGGTSSQEGPEGKAFHTQPRVFTTQEMGKMGLQLQVVTFGEK